MARKKTKIPKPPKPSPPTYRPGRQGNEPDMSIIRQPAIMARIGKIILLICNGLQPHQIVEYCHRNAAKLGWKVKDAEIYNYIRQAQAELRNRFEGDRKYLIAVATVRLNQLYQIALTRRDDKGRPDIYPALAVQREINRLFGLYAPVKVDVTSGGLSIRDKRDLNTIEDLDFAECEVIDSGLNDINTENTEVKQIFEEIRLPDDIQGLPVWNEFTDSIQETK